MPTNPKKPAAWPRYAAKALQQTLEKLAAISNRINAQDGLDAKAKLIEAKAKEIQYAAQRGESIKVLSLTAELRNINADGRTDLLELDRLAIDAQQILKGAATGDYGTADN
jgi:hypothetical protein